MGERREQYGTIFLTDLERDLFKTVQVSTVRKEGDDGRAVRVGDGGDVPGKSNPLPRRQGARGSSEG